MSSINNLNEDSIFIDQDTGEELPELKFPYWYKATKEEQKALTNGSLSDTTLKKIIEDAFQKIADQLPGYQTRQSQIDMSKELLLSMYKYRTAIIEAATGVGKSFAYLIASVSFAYLTAEKVYISTETKSLQMQLFEKDIQFIKKYLQEDLEYSLTLGSSNYFCQIKYEDTFATGRFLDLIDEDQVEPFHDWVKSIFKYDLEGNRFEYPSNIPDGFWSTVARDSDSCPSMRCQFFAKCNYFRTKKKWQNSRILIGNHHLLLYHLLNEKRTLPQYACVVLDEAHGFAKTGFQIFTLSYSATIIDDKQKQLERTLRTANHLPVELKEDLLDPMGELVKDWGQLFSQWEVQLDLTFTEDSTQIIEKHKEISSDSIIANLEALRATLSDVIENEEDTQFLAIFKSLLKFFEQATRFAKSFNRFDYDKFVYWAEKRKGTLHLFSCNLSLGELLKEWLTEPVMYTSATLGYWGKSKAPSSVAELITNGYFNNFEIDNITQSNKTTKKVYFSPFNYSKKAALFIPEDLELPAWGSDENIQQAYESELLTLVEKIINLSKGGSLVLFTSKYLLAKAYDYLEERLAMPVYSQLKLGPNKALDHFRDDENSVLLGTSSFWQGVDISGHGLRNLIITKLMFTRPDDPIYQARSKQIENRGGKAFNELALPTASQMLRQAFGRLIRNETDKGIVSILDNRLLTKFYGKLLMANLPQVRLVTKFNELKAFCEKSGILIKDKK